MAKGRHLKGATGVLGDEVAPNYLSPWIRHCEPPELWNTACEQQQVIRVGLKPVQPLRLHWALAMVVEQVVYFCQILVAHENCRKAYKSHC